MSTTSNEASSKVYVCPNCQQELQKKNNKTYFCNSCNSIVNIEDWSYVANSQRIFTNQDFRDKVLSSRGLVPVLSLFYKTQQVYPNPKSDKCNIPEDLKNQKLSKSFAHIKPTSVIISKELVETEDGFSSYQLKLQKIKDIDLSVETVDGIHALSVNEQVDLHEGDIITIKNIELVVGIKYEIDLEAAADTILKTKNIVINNNTLSMDKLFTIISSSNSNFNPNIPSNPDADIEIGIDNPSSDSSLHINIIIYYCSNSWWICDESYSKDKNSKKIFLFPCLKVNGKNVHCKELFLGDKIEFAGKSYKFMVDSLTEFNQNSKGPAIHVENLNAARGKYNLFSDVSFDVKPGEFIGILGHSGCGKTSLIHRLAGLVQIKPDEGSISINDGCPEDYRSESAYIHQYPALHESITVMQECLCFAKLHTVLSKSEIESHINSVLSLVNLDESKSKPVHLLSGGEKKRLSLALELLREPKLLILDEPTSGLDPANEKEIMKYLRRLADQGKTVICSTHMMDNVESFHKVLILRKIPGRGGVIDCYLKPTEALDHYNVSSYSEIYQRLVNSENGFTDSISTANCNTVTQPENKKQITQKQKTAPKPGCLRQILAYFSRDWHQFKSFWHSNGVWEKIKDFFRGDLFFQWILQPILIALCIRLACNGKYYSLGPDKDCPGTVFFFCLISIFWLGMNNAIRELVSERYPDRCLERLKELSLTIYLTSKIIWVVFLCLVQTLIFCFCLFTLSNYLPLPTPSDEDLLNVICWDWLTAETFMMFITLWLMCILGSLIALAISATFKKESVALSVMPLVLIPLLLFSYPVMQIDDKLCNWGKYFERCLPCKNPQAYLEQVNDYSFSMNKKTQSLATAAADSGSETISVDNGQQNENAKSLKETFASLFSGEFLKALTSLFLWALLALFWMIFWQYYNEENWEGR